MAWAVYLLVGSVLGVTCSVSAQGTNATGDNGSRTIIVGAIQNPSFLHKREDGTFEGYHVDLMTELSDLIRFDFVIKEPADMKYGSLREDGTWTGMVGELVRGETDMALGLIIASPREAVIDFSAVVLDDRLEMLVKKPETTRREWWRVIMPIPVWLMVMGSFLLAAIVMFVIIRVSPYENRAYSTEVGEASRLSTFGHSLWICYSVMSWQGVDYSPRSVSGRFLFVFWFGFIVWTLILITGAIAGFFLASPAAFPVVPIESFDDLAATDGIRPAFYGGGATEMFFKNFPSTSFQRLLQRAIRVSSTDEGLKLVRGGGVAFITESSVTQFYSNVKPCDLMAIHDGSTETTRYQAIGLPVGSPFREKLNIAIMHLRESGRLHVLYRKWVAPGECTHQSDSFSKTRPASFQRLTTSDLMPVFIELVVAAILALCIMGIEVKWDKRTAKQPDAAPSGKSAGPRDDDRKV
ncbi:PREDICTED: glutamate receptor-like [Branchiostoma belcheri]|uniref:Glutamate receptor-like n=1 Tax=Branchiostoma belcheri TaxID=7741 RepID=A0A6P4YCE9_BRABE|nr:PREDICTED: glutamate receptor-like [Branchiostoma belcheri]